MKNILLCFLLCCCLDATFAAEKKDCSSCAIVGTVVDAATKKPIADVMVIARGQQSGDEQKFMTDQHGLYKIPSLSSGTYVLRFEKHNYKSVEKRNLAVKKASSNAKINVELVFDDNEGQEDHHNWLPKY
ncbi:MAG: carboxypeptidase-like regulatory domain-containing protein, partial [Panacibacter sp.]